MRSWAPPARRAWAAPARPSSVAASAASAPRAAPAEPRVVWPAPRAGCAAPRWRPAGFQPAFEARHRRRRPELWRALQAPRRWRRANGWNESFLELQESELQPSIACLGAGQILKKRFGVRPGALDGRSRIRNRGVCIRGEAIDESHFGIDLCVGCVDDAERNF